MERFTYFEKVKSEFKKLIRVLDLSHKRIESFLDRCLIKYANIIRDFYFQRKIFRQIFDDIEKNVLEHERRFSLLKMIFTGLEDELRKFRRIIDSFYTILENFYKERGYIDEDLKEVIFKDLNQLEEIYEDISKIYEVEYDFISLERIFKNIKMLLKKAKRIKFFEDPLSWDYTFRNLNEFLDEVKIILERISFNLDFALTSLNFAQKKINELRSKINS